MRRVLPVAIVVAALLLQSVPSADSSIQSDRVWFCPGPGTLDYLRLFEHPEEWSRARKLVSVFKFYEGHTQTPPPENVGPNTYDAFIRVGAFRMLRQWGIKTAIEVGAVKDFYCTADASGPAAAVADTVRSVNAVQSAGGIVAYLAMDEPFVSGRDRVCGGPALEPTADRVTAYVAGVHAAFPDIQIGLIEAYPFSSEAAIETIVALLRSRNATPAFLHMDVDWHLSGAAAFTRDMARLQAFCATEQIPFGIIIVGYNGEADALYAVDVYGLTDLIAATFHTWSAMPDHLIFQSWVTTQTGLFITPSNLDERQAFTHTDMLRDIYRRLRGADGAAIDTAIGRR